MPWRSAHAPNSASAPAAPPLNKMQSAGFIRDVPLSQTTWVVESRYGVIDIPVWATVECGAQRYVGELTRPQVSRQAPHRFARLRLKPGRRIATLKMFVAR